MNKKGEKRNKNYIRVLKYMLMPVPVAIFPAVFLYANNAAEAAPKTALFGVGYFALETVVIYLVFLLFTRSTSHSSLAASLIALFLNNYKMIEDVLRDWFPTLKYWHFLLLGCLVLGHILWFIFKRCKKEIVRLAVSVLSLVMTGLCVMNLCIAIPGLSSYIKLMNEKKNSAIASGAGDETLPNFYYFIFDEYSGYNAAEKLFGDNGNDNISYFQELEFNVSTTSYSGTLKTVYETANLFNLDYVIQANDDTAKAIQERMNPPFFQLLREKGYAVHGVGSEAVAGYGLPAAYEVSAKEAETMDGKSFWTLLLGNTVIYPTLEFQDLYSDLREDRLNSLNYFHNKIDHTARGQFYLLHIICPHVPYIFDKNGNALDASDSANYADKSIYFGQYQYMTNEMKKIAESIVRSEPDSIIILQSDHGYRDYITTEDMEKINECIAHNELDSIENRFNVLNNVYYRGQKLDIEGKTTINTLRTILNDLFGMELDMLTPPEGMFKK